MNLRLPKRVAAITAVLCAIGASAAEVRADSAPSSQVTSTVAVPAGTTVPLPLPESVGFSVRVGTFFPYDDTARSLGGFAPPSVGIEYRPLRSGLNRPSPFSAYLDYIQETTAPGRVGGTSFGVAFKTSGRFSFGVGLGTTTTYTSLAGPGYLLTSSRTRLGGKIFLAKRLANGASLELTDYIFPAALGINPSGIGIASSVRI